MLEACGERIHPASAALANESRHIAAESGDHELNVFQAWRRMDEILLANFMVFRDVARAERLRPLDRRRGVGARLLPAREPGAEDAPPYGFLTDFVGWLPMAEGGEDEARLTADYNAEMLEHIAALPGRARPRDLRRLARRRRAARLRRRACPRSGPWVEEHFAFSGYVLAPDAAPADREALRAELGYGAGRAGLHRHGRRLGRRRRAARAASSPRSRRRASASRACGWSPSAGPRIDPDSLRRADGRRGPRLRPPPLAPPRGVRRRASSRAA